MDLLTESNRFSQNYATKTKRRRDFIAGSIGVLSIHIFALGILIKRWDILPPFTIAYLFCTVFFSLSLFGATLNRHRELEELFAATDLTEDTAFVKLLYIARRDLYRQQLMFWALNIAALTGLSALVRSRL
jgi:hypothetical protein